MIQIKKINYQGRIRPVARKLNKYFENKTKLITQGGFVPWQENFKMIKIKKMIYLGRIRPVARKFQND